MICKNQFTRSGLPVACWEGMIQCVVIRDAEAEAEAGGSGSLSMEVEAEAEAQI